MVIAIERAGVAVDALDNRFDGVAGILST